MYILTTVQWGSLAWSLALYEYSSIKIGKSPIRITLYKKVILSTVNALISNRDKYQGFSKIFAYTIWNHYKTTFLI